MQVPSWSSLFIFSLSTLVLSVSLLSLIMMFFYVHILNIYIYIIKWIQKINVNMSKLSLIPLLPCNVYYYYQYTSVVSYMKVCVYTYKSMSTVCVCVCVSAGGYSAGGAAWGHSLPWITAGGQEQIQYLPGSLPISSTLSLIWHTLRVKKTQTAAHLIVYSFTLHEREVMCSVWSCFQ